MRILWVACLVGIVWAQEESRIRENTPTRTTRSIPRAPTPPPQSEAEVVLMETFSGKVVDNEGKGAANIRLWFVDKATGKVLGETRTDGQGGFAIAVPAVESLIVRMSREGKEFVEREFSFQELIRSEPELVFAP